MIATEATSAARQTADRQSGVLDFLSRFSLVIVLICMVAFFSVASPSSFFTVDNFQTIANQQVPILLLALAASLPLMVAEFDLSIGYILGLCQAFVIGLMANSGLSIPLAIVLVLALATGIGFVNGLLVVKARINALITTLATGSVLGGVVIAYTGGAVIFEGVPSGFTTIARDELAGIPLPIFYAIAIVAALALFTSFTPAGRRMYAIGGNRQAAVLNGIKVDKIIVGTFVVSAILCGAAGILMASRLGSAQPGLGPQFLLPAFAAAFLGATTIRPGRFNVLGTVVAAYVLAVPVAGLQQLGVESWFEPVFNGVALVVAVGLSGQIAQLRARRARKAQLMSVRASAAASHDDRDGEAGAAERSPSTA